MSRACVDCVKQHVDCVTEPVADILEIRGCVQKLRHDMYISETYPADRVFAEIYKIRSKQFSIPGVLKKTEL